MLRLRISRKGVNGYQVSSVSMRKLMLLVVDEHRFWSLDGDFLVLNSY